MAIEKMVGQFPGLGRIWADVGYAGKPVDWVKEVAGCGLESARRRKGERGFAVLPRRRAIERTPAWLGKYRRMSEGCERLAETSDAWIRMAMICLTLRRLAM